MPRLIIELTEDIRFEDGAWVPADDRARALIEAVRRCCSQPSRLFSREAAVLDRERVAARPTDALPDLNLFYVVDGEPAELEGLELVAQVGALLPSEPLALELPDGVTVVEAPPEGRPLADAIDVAAAEVPRGQPLVVRAALRGRAAWAAAELAARRGVRVYAAAGEAVPAWVRRLVVVPAAELAAASSSAVVSSPSTRASVASVTIETVLLAAGGDLSGSALYLEGWVEDDGERTPFRVPETGAVRGVERGDTVELQAVVYRGTRPVTRALAVHIEVWEADLGRDSLLDPDDLLGVIDARFTEGARWGHGRHENVRTEGEGECLVSYRVELESAPRRP